MYRVPAVLFLVLLPAFASAQTPASERGAVLATVHRFVDGFNKGDTKMLFAACGDQTSILDEFPPYEWHGAGACEKWVADFDVDAKKKGITGGVVTLHTPTHVDIAADRAYVVIPANYDFKQKGKPVGEAGSIIALTLQKTSAGWRITGWSWAKH